jgi:hypothetical protein
MSRLTLICTAAVISATAGCASEGLRPTEELARAHTLVTQADKTQAQRYAAADLQRAHDELSDADRADRNQKYDEARSYAESAAVDADLASARSSAEEAQRAAHEVERGNATLEQEGLRQTGSPDTVPAAPAMPDMSAYPPAPANSTTVPPPPPPPPAPPDNSAPH